MLPVAVARSSSAIQYVMYFRVYGWLLVGWLVGSEINVPFQHKNRLYRGQSLEWRLVPPG